MNFGKKKKPAGTPAWNANSVSTLREADRLAAQAGGQQQAIGNSAFATGRRRELSAQGGGKKIVKVTIAGSGDETWATHASGADNALDPTQAGEWEKKSKMGNAGWNPASWFAKEQPHYYKKTTSKHGAQEQANRGQISVAGPGAKNTKRNWKKELSSDIEDLPAVGALAARGVWDHGSNSIEALRKTVPQKIFDELVGDSKPEDTLVLVKAHSRGAVAAGHVAKTMAGLGFEVEAVLFDPVPGPAHKGDNLDNDLSAIPNLTVVYSVASGYSTGFKPQLVRGAKRIIISRQNHSAGLEAGFRFGGKNYLGSRLNSLPPGVFIDSNETGKRAAELEALGGLDEAKAGLHAMLALRENAGDGMDGKQKTTDEGRPEVIEAALNSLYAHAQAAQAAQAG